MKNHFFPLILAAAPLLVAGCATDMHYVQTGDKEQIISGQINIQDYENAANAAVNDLLASGALSRVPNPPAILYVSTIINNTDQQVDTDLLTHKITMALLQSGKALTTTTDPAASGFQQQSLPPAEQKNLQPPDFTLSGKIIETVDRAGDTSRYTYTFQLSLNGTRSGLQLWEGEKEIGKQGTRAAVGF
jgi:penicillin-binding protein activator